MIPLLTPYPDPAPSRSNPSDVFIARADSKVAHDIVIVGEMNDDVIPGINAAVEDINEATDAAEGAALQAAAAALGAVSSTIYVATSASNLSPTAGSKIIQTSQTGRGFAVNDRAVLLRRSDPSVRIAGAITVSDGSDDYTLVADDVAGSGGPYTDWFMMLEALEPVYWATAAMIWEAARTAAAVNPVSLKLSAAYVSLTYAATLNINLAAGFKRSTVLTGSPTIAAPTGAFDGAPLTIKFEMGVGGGSPSWASGAGGWDFQADGVPVFPSGTGKFHYVDAEYDSARGKWRATYSPPA